MQINPRVFFGLAYRIGFTPWDGHPLATRLRELVEGPAALPTGRALDVGCGTGDTSIYLARHGWDVTGVDFINRALRRAESKAQVAGASVRFQQADATRLTELGIRGPFQLVADNGCMHGMSDDARDAYVRELTALVPPGGRLVLLGFAEKHRRRGPRGFNRPEIERRFGRGWQLLASDVDSVASARRPEDPVYFYDLRRA